MKAHLAHIATKEALFIELQNELTLPAYFGHNWDALEECLCDDGLAPAGSELVLTHTGVTLPPEDMKVYLEILTHAHEEQLKCGVKLTWSFE